MNRIISWSLQKLLFALLLGVLAVAGFALRIFLQDKVDYDLRRQEIVRTLTGEVAKLQATLREVPPKMAEARAALAAQQERAAQAAKVVRELDGLSSGLNRLTTDSNQLQENSERRERMKQMEIAALKRAGELEQEMKRIQWEKDGLEIALNRLQLQRKSVEEDNSKPVHYAREAWANHRPSILAIMALCLVGPFFTRVFAYAVFAPTVSARPPVLLGAVSDQLPEITASGPTVALPLSFGDTLWVRKGFVQTAEEDLVQKHRRILDWQWPLSWYAAGLTELSELRNRTPGTAYKTTIANRENPGAALTLVTLLPETSLVLRPNFLAGAVGLNGRKLTIRRHWRWFHWQSWVRGQFGYFEFCGPCRLLVAATRNVRPEVLANAKGKSAPAQRLSQAATVGFTPGLTYRTARTGSFWAYLRGQAPLFDDLFSGQGLFLGLQDPPEGAAPKFWSRFRDAGRKLFGV